MFVDLNGDLYDYFNGAEDLAHKRIRFVGDPVERIQEDYLRIFRYFRFFARYGEGTNHDQKTLQAIATNVDGLKGISGERIWSEMKRILPLPNSRLVVPIMVNDVAIAPHLGLPDEKRDLSEFERAHANLFGAPATVVEPITLFTSLVKSSEELQKCKARLKLSNIEFDTAFYILLNRDEKDVAIDDLRKQIALAPQSDQSHLKVFVIEFLRYVGRSADVDVIRDWQVPQFPLRGDVIGRKLVKKSNIKVVVEDLKHLWADSGFKMSESELAGEIENVIRERGFAMKDS